MEMTKQQVNGARLLVSFSDALLGKLGTPMPEVLSNLTREIPQVGLTVMHFLAVLGKGGDTIELDQLAEEGAKCFVSFITESIQLEDIRDGSNKGVMDFIRLFSQDTDTDITDMEVFVASFRLKEEEIH